MYIFVSVQACLYRPVMVLGLVSPHWHGVVCKEVAPHGTGAGCCVWCLHRNTHMHSRTYIQERTFPILQYSSKEMESLRKQFCQRVKGCMVQ